MANDTLPRPPTRPSQSNSVQPVLLPTQGIPEMTAYQIPNTQHILPDPSMFGNLNTNPDPNPGISTAPSIPNISMPGLGDTPNIDLSGLSEVDFGGLGLDELNAMINGQQFNFPSNPNVNGNGNGSVDIGDIMNGQSQPQIDTQTQTQIPTQRQDMSEAERILDSLGSLARPDTAGSSVRGQGDNRNVPIIPAQYPSVGLQPLPPSLGDVQPQLSVTSQLQQPLPQQPVQAQQSVDDLFGAIAPVSATSLPTQAPSIQNNSLALDFNQTSQQTGLGLTATPGDVDLSSLAGLFGGGQSAVGAGPGAGAGIGGEDEVVGNGAFEGIDLDDYNFNDGMIGVDGDEFESLLAQF
jgi:hypothetical protein